MMRILLFLGTNIAIIALISVTFRILGLDDLLPHPAGVRAQAVARDGTMIHDFLVEHTARSLHVGNAPSPAATSALPIARHLCDLFLDD